MQEVKYTARFQRDYKREKSGRHSKKLGADFFDPYRFEASSVIRRDGSH